jgi:hypothetical protein
MAPKYFQKINFNIPNLDFDALKGTMVTSYQAPTMNISYYKITNRTILKLLWNIVPFSIKPDYVMLSEVTGYGLLNAHRDHGVVSGLNYYIQTNDEITSFYSLTDKFKNDDQLTNYFTSDQIVFQDSFVAKPNDCYLLDIGQIHSVRSNGGIRRFITWQWISTDYNTVLLSFLPHLSF